MLEMTGNWKFIGSYENDNENIAAGFLLMTSTKMRISKKEINMHSLCVITVCESIDIPKKFLIRSIL